MKGDHWNSGEACCWRLSFFLISSFALSPVRPHSSRWLLQSSMGGHIEGCCVVKAIWENCHTVYSPSVRFESNLLNSLRQNQVYVLWVKCSEIQFKHQWKSHIRRNEDLEHGDSNTEDWNVERYGLERWHNMPLVS